MSKPAESLNEDSTGLDMYYGWITSVHHNKRYAGKLLGSTKEQKTDQEQIGED